MRRCRCALLSILLPGIVPLSAWAQAAAEAALGAGRAATAAAPLKDAGKRLGAVLEKAGKALDAGKAPSASTVVRSPAPPPKRGAVSCEDPAGIKTGMNYEEVLRRFGPPLFTLTGASGTKTLSYACKGASVDVDVRAGKVVSVWGGPPGPQPAPRPAHSVDDHEILRHSPHDSP